MYCELKNKLKIIRNTESFNRALCIVNDFMKGLSDTIK